MAEQVSAEPGAPFPKDTIDPELIKLSRARPKIGVITAAGLVFLCGYFLVRLDPDRRFSGGPSVPDRIALVDVIGGNIGVDRFIKLEGAVPLMSHAVRATTSKGSLGLRVVPIRGTGDRVWVAMSGDGWDQASLGTYSGRLRWLSDLPFSTALGDYATEHPRPVFATAAAVRAGLASGKVQSVSADPIAIADSDHVGFDVVDRNAAVVVCVLNDRFPTAAAWSTALGAARITITGSPRVSEDAIRYDVTIDGDLAALGAKLENAHLWAARVEPVTHHYETTWGALKGSSPAGFVVKDATIPDAQVDLIGLYVERAIPRDAYVVITGERPDDYWYVLPITIALAIIGLVFAWALVRAVKRDFLPSRA